MPPAGRSHGQVLRGRLDKGLGAKLGDPSCGVSPDHRADQRTELLPVVIFPILVSSIERFGDLIAGCSGSQKQGKEEAGFQAVQRSRVD